MRACLQKRAGAELVVDELFPLVEEARLQIIVRLSLISDELLLLDKLGLDHHEPWLLVEKFQQGVDSKR